MTRVHTLCFTLVRAVGMPAPTYTGRLQQERGDLYHPPMSSGGSFLRLNTIWRQRFVTKLQRENLKSILTKAKLLHAFLYCTLQMGVVQNSHTFIAQNHLTQW